MITLKQIKKNVREEVELEIKKVEGTTLTISWDRIEKVIGLVLEIRTNQIIDEMIGTEKRKPWKDCYPCGYNIKVRELEEYKKKYNK